MILRHHCRLSFDALERRLELTTISAVMHLDFVGTYPAAFVGPIPPGARREPKGVALPAVEYPSTWLSTQEPSIGAPVAAGVQFSQSSLRRLADVNYKIVGGAIATQTWTTSTGGYTRTQGVDHALNPPQILDQWDWSWDETLAQKSVTIKATDDLGNQFSYSFGPFTVTAPTPSAYLIRAAAAQIGPVGTRWGLLSSAGGAQGVQYSAQITMPSYGGTGGFVQLVNKQMSASGTVPVGGQYTNPFAQTDNYPNDPNLMALDSPQSGPVLYGGYSVSLMPGSMTQVGGQQNPTGWQPTDAPGQEWPTPDGTTAFTTSVSFTQTFKTYLDYQPLGGIHIELGEIDWSITATAQYKGPTYPMTRAQYQDPSNWTVTAPQPSVRSPSYGPQLITWGINVQVADSEYTKWTYGQ